MIGVLDNGDGSADAPLLIDLQQERQWGTNDPAGCLHYPVYSMETDSSAHRSMPSIRFIKSHSTEVDPSAHQTPAEHQQCVYTHPALARYIISTFSSISPQIIPLTYNSTTILQQPLNLPTRTVFGDVGSVGG